MCIYFVKDNSNAAEAISLMLRSDADKEDFDTRQQAGKRACHFIRCQKTERCVGTALVVR